MNPASYYRAGNSKARVLNWKFRVLMEKSANHLCRGGRGRGEGRGGDGGRGEGGGGVKPDNAAPLRMMLQTQVPKHELVSCW